MTKRYTAVVEIIETTSEELDNYGKVKVASEKREVLKIVVRAEDLSELKNRITNTVEVGA